MTDEIPKNQLMWAALIAICVFLTCTTALYINANMGAIRFEMDENSLEAVKSVNWTAMQTVETCSNKYLADAYDLLDLRLEMLEEGWKRDEFPCNTTSCGWTSIPTNTEKTK